MANEEARARAGATFMDATRVGWPMTIDAGTLDMSSCDDCVFGQAFDDNFINVARRLGLTRGQCAALGFCSEMQAEPDLEAFLSLSSEALAVRRAQITAEYRLLRAAWLHEIALRLGTPAPTQSAPSRRPRPAPE